MRPVAPRTGDPEQTYAENQLEYAAVTVAIHDNGDGSRYLLTRWRLTDEEKAAVARGEDVYVAQLNFGQSMTPLVVQIGAGWFQQGPIV
jgi:hypothetical protein